MGIMGVLGAAPLRRVRGLGRAPDGAAWEAWRVGRQAGFISLIGFISFISLINLIALINLIGFINLIALIALINLMRPLGERRLCAAGESMLACPGRGAVGFALGGLPSGSRGWSGAVRRGAVCAAVRQPGLSMICRDIALRCCFVVRGAILRAKGTSLQSKGSSLRLGGAVRRGVRRLRPTSPTSPTVALSCREKKAIGPGNRP